MRYVIGDIHGNIDELENMLLNLKVVKQLVFLGDHLDKKDFLKEVIALIIKIKKLYDIVLLTVNHEYVYLNYLKKILRSIRSF